MPTEYVRSKHWDHRDKKDQLNLQTCPLCSDSKWHFFMGKDGGAWDCKKCGESGNLYQLKKRLGDIEECIHPASRKEDWKKPDQQQVRAHHQSIFSDGEVVRYLLDRGITMDSIKYFHLGVKPGDKGKLLSIPWIRGKEYLNVKYRTLPPATKGFTRVDGCRSILFNENAIQDHDTVILTEGEIDAITLWQHGFSNVAGSFDAEWVGRLEKVKKVFICYDADEAGQKGAVAAAKRLGYGRCWNVVLPVKDANDFFMNHTKEQFWTLLDRSKQFKLPGIITVRDAMDLLQGELRDGKEDPGIQTPWDNVNRVISGWKPGDLIIVTALPKTGKTTFCLEIARSLISIQVPSLFFCLEMRPERIFRKLIQAEFHVENPTIEHIHAARTLYEHVPLYLGHSYKFRKPEDLLQNITDAISRFGLQFVVFDNLHLLCRSDRVNELLSQTVLAFKMLAEEAEIPIVVIAQPRKRESGGNEIISAEDVKYSSSIHSDCDQMIILHRNRTVTKAKDIGKDTLETKNESMDPITLVRVEAHRYGPGGETLLYYNGAQSRFEQLARGESMAIVRKGTR
jgi:hypothetical protein